MHVDYTQPFDLNPEARALVKFDIGSIERVVASRSEPKPEFWVAAPEGYQVDGHARRDSETIRMVASFGAEVIYATDGCNACRHNLDRPLTDYDEVALGELAARTQLPLPMIAKLAERARHGPNR